MATGDHNHCQMQGLEKEDEEEITLVLVSLSKIVANIFNGAPPFLFSSTLTLLSVFSVFPVFLLSCLFLALEQIAAQPSQLQKGFDVPTTPSTTGPSSSAENPPSLTTLLSSPPQSAAGMAGAPTQRQDPMGKKIMTGRFVDF